MCQSRCRMVISTAASSYTILYQEFRLPMAIKMEPHQITTDTQMRFNWKSLLTKTNQSRFTNLTCISNIPLRKHRIWLVDWRVELHPSISLLNILWTLTASGHSLKRSFGSCFHWPCLLLSSLCTLCLPRRVLTRSLKHKVVEWVRILTTRRSSSELSSLLWKNSLTYSFGIL